MGVQISEGILIRDADLYRNGNASIQTGIKRMSRVVAARYCAFQCLTAEINGVDLH